MSRAALVCSASLQPDFAKIQIVLYRPNCLARLYIKVVVPYNMFEHLVVKSYQNDEVLAAYRFITCLPMLINPVFPYMPTHAEFSLFASPLRLTLRIKQGDSTWLEQVRFASSLYFPLL